MSFCRGNGFAYAGPARFDTGKDEEWKMGKYIRLSVSIIIVLLVFARLGRILAANYDGNQSMDGFYRMERNTADVIFYGSSHVYSGINTALLWDDYGIAGYNLAGTMQTLWNTYYNMEETLKYQSPRMMVVDLYGILIEDEYYGSTNVIKNVSSMRFSMNKVRNVWNSVPHEEFLSYLASYPLTHDSWKRLKQGNYIESVNNIGGEWYKGYKPSYAVTRYDMLPQLKESTKVKEASEKNRRYLDKMVMLAREHQVQLAFIVVPYEGINDEDQMLYRWAEDYAEENGILFLNGNAKLEEIQMNPAEDYAEASHLNHSGACKFTAYLGEWLIDNCDWKDHRGDEKWVSWQRYSDCWAAWEQNRELAECTDIESYLGMLQRREDDIVIVSLDDNYKNNTYLQPLEKLLGINLYELDGSASIVVDDHAILYQTPAEPEYLWYIETDLSDIAISRTYGDAMKVQINNIQRNNNSNDVTIVVYDRKLDMVADVVSYNSDGVMIR